MAAELSLPVTFLCACLQHYPGWFIFQLSLMIILTARWKAIKVGRSHSKLLPRFHCLSPSDVPAYSIIQADSYFSLVLWIYLQPSNRKLKWGRLTIDGCPTLAAFSPFCVPAYSIIQADSYFSFVLWLYLQPSNRKLKWGRLTIDGCPTAIACHFFVCLLTALSRLIHISA